MRSINEKQLLIGICDDEANARRVLSNILQKVIDKQQCVYQLEEFASGRELLDWEGKLQLVFLDLNMPEIDGIESGIRLKEKNSDCIIEQHLNEAGLEEISLNEAAKFLGGADSSGKKRMVKRNTHIKWYIEKTAVVYKYKNKSYATRKMYAIDDGTGLSRLYSSGVENLYSNKQRTWKKAEPVVKLVAQKALQYGAPKLAKIKSWMPVDFSSKLKANQKYTCTATYNSSETACFIFVKPQEKRNTDYRMSYATNRVRIYADIDMNILGRLKIESKAYHNTIDALYFNSARKRAIRAYCNPYGSDTTSFVRYYELCDGTGKYTFRKDLNCAVTMGQLQ